MRKIEFAIDKGYSKGDFGSAPILQWVKIEDLVIDDTYQRDLKAGNWKAIRQIAARFKWSRFSPVFVAPVEGGKFAIIDGQHRTHAAALCGFTEVPCQIVHMPVAEQAAAFAAVNGMVTKVTLWQILKAALAAGEDGAIRANEACEMSGCKLMTNNATTEAKKPGEIYAVALVKANITTDERFKSLVQALTAIRQSEFGSEAPAYSNEILRPFVDAVVQRPWLVEQGASLVGFADDFDIYAAIDKAQELAKQKRRMGSEYMSANDIATAHIGEGLDKAFPQRMALPSVAA